MTYLVEINYTKATKIILFMLWASISILPLYGIGIQIITLASFSEDGDW